MDDSLTFAAAALEGAPDELPYGLLTGGSSDPELVPFVGAALLAYGIETDWSRGQNASAMTGSMTAGIARFREMVDVHEPTTASTSGTQAEADHYVGPETWRALIGGARDKLDAASSSDTAADDPVPSDTALSPSTAPASRVSPPVQEEPRATSEPTPTADAPTATAPPTAAEGPGPIATPEPEGPGPVDPVIAGQGNLTEPAPATVQEDPIAGAPANGDATT